MSAPAHGPALPRAYRDRLRQALAEVGETDVRPGVAGILTAAFLLLAAAPGLIEIAFGGDHGVFARGIGMAGVQLDPVSDRNALAAIAGANRALLAAITEAAHRLENDTTVVRLLRPGLQHGFTNWLRASATRVYLGRDGWLFYGPDVDYVAGPGFLDAHRLATRAAAGDTLADAPAPDPRPPIVGLHRQLAARGIVLVVMPTPVKPTVHPERLRGGRPDVRSVENLSYDAFVRGLRAQGVAVFEPGAALAREGATAAAAPFYLATDTHWRPETVERVAAALAARIRRETTLPAVDATVTRRAAVTVSNTGDTLRLLDLPAWQTRYRSETVTIHPVEIDGGPWRAARDADVLLLGDSFTNVYSAAAMGWGEGAGLAEQLAYALRRPVDRLSQNDDGAFASRERLAAAMARGEDRLAAKRVVVLQFATRELAFGNWRAVDVSGRARRPVRASFIEPGPGDRLRTRATVREIARMPRPGSVPYPDHIVAIRLAGLDPPPDAAGGEVVIYAWSLRDNEPTRAAALGPGHTVELDLVPWAEVAEELDTINRSELTDPGARLATPWWGRFPEDQP